MDAIGAYSSSNLAPAKRLSAVPPVDPKQQAADRREEQVRVRQEDDTRERDARSDRAVGGKVDIKT